MNVQFLHVEVPASHQGVAAGSDLRDAVVLRAMIANPRSPRVIDVDRPGILLPRTRIAWRRNAHNAQDTRAPPHPPGTLTPLAGAASPWNATASSP
jgi:hypothetical protein